MLVSSEAAVEARPYAFRFRSICRSRLATTTVALAASGSTAFIFNVVAARRLPSDSFGDVARTYAVGLAIAQLTMASLAPALAWRVASGGDDKERWMLARDAARMAGIAAVLIGTAAYPLALLAGFAPSSMTLVIEGWAFAVIYSFYFGLKLVLFAADMPRAYAAFELSADAVFFLALACLALISPGDVLIAFAVAYGLFSAAVVLWLRRRMPVRKAVTLGRSFWRYSLLAGVATYSSAARAPIAVVVAGAAAGASIAGHLSAAVAVTMPLFLLPQAAGVLTFASVARERGAATQLVVNQIRSTAHWTSAVMAVAIALTPVVIPLVFGAQFRVVSVVFLIVAIGLTPQLLATPIGNALAGEGRVGISAAASAVGIVVAVAVIPFAAAAWGARGAAAGLGVGTLLGGLVLIGIGRRRYAIPHTAYAPAAYTLPAIAIAAAILSNGWWH